MIKHIHSTSITLPKDISPLFSLNNVMKISLEKHEDFSLPESDFISLLCIEKGDFLFTSPDIEANYSMNQAILLPTHCPYEIYAKKPLSFSYLSFCGSLSQTLLESTLQKGNFYHPQNFIKIKSQIEHIESLLNRSSTTPNELSVSIFSLLMLLSNQSQQTGTPLYPPIISSAIAIMEEEYAYLYGIEELSDKLEVGKHHFIRLFTKNVGISPLKYLTAIKLKHSKEQLKNTNLPLEFIAISCGFSSANYFYKVFKKEFGISPSQYRDRYPNQTKHDYHFDELYL